MYIRHCSCVVVSPWQCLSSLPSRASKVFPNHQMAQQSGCIPCFAEVGYALGITLYFATLHTGGEKHVTSACTFTATQVVPLCPSYNATHATPPVPPPGPPHFPPWAGGACSEGDTALGCAAVPAPHDHLPRGRAPAVHPNDSTAAAQRLLREWTGGRGIGLSGLLVSRGICALDFNICCVHGMVAMVMTLFCALLASPMTFRSLFHS